MTRIIGIVSTKGGVGKSMVSTNLSVGLTMKNYKTLLFETDPQKSGEIWHKGGGHNLVEFLSIKDDEHISNYKKTFEKYDVVVIDGAPHLEDSVAATINICDTVIMPVGASAVDTWILPKLLHLTTVSQKLREGKPEVACLINSQKKKSRASTKVLEQLSEYNLPILEAKLSNSVIYSDTYGEGKSIFCIKSPFYYEFMGLVDEIISKYVNMNICSYEDIKIC